MVTVEEFFKTLSHGPLSNLALANEGNGTIAESSQGKIINYMNDGLLRLYSKFVLLERELFIRMIDGHTNYYMMSRFSQSGHVEGSTDPIYILDALDPYKDDLIKILEVHGPNGQEYPLNDAESEYSLFTPRVNQLQVPEPIGDATLSVLYQARHPKLEYGVTTTKLQLPISMLEALQAFVASKVFQHMNGQDNSAKGAEHYTIFQSLIGETVENDLANSSNSTTNTNFERRGFV